MAADCEAPYLPRADPPDVTHASKEPRGMSRSLNKVMLIGNVGNDPEIRATAKGTRVAKLSIATNRSWNDASGQKQEKTEWHRCSFWGRLADIVEQYVHKGDRLYVEGRLEYSQTQDDQGATRYWTDIVVNEMVMLSGGSGAGAEEGGRSFSGGGGGWEGGPARRGGGGRGSREAPPPLSQPDDDLPF
jgi:single-strand DNA-binding protein